MGPECAVRNWSSSMIPAKFSVTGSAVAQVSFCRPLSAGTRIWYGARPREKCGRPQLKYDCTRWRTGWEVKGKLANALGSQYSSHYLGTWCIPHYYRWSAQLGWRSRLNCAPPPRRFKWTRPLRRKDEIWFLLVCHRVSTGLYPKWHWGGLSPCHCHLSSHECFILTYFLTYLLTYLLTNFLTYLRTFLHTYLLTNFLTY